MRVSLSQVKHNKNKAEQARNQHQPVIHAVSQSQWHLFMYVNHCNGSKCSVLSIWGQGIPASLAYIWRNICALLSIQLVDQSNLFAVSVLFFFAFILLFAQFIVFSFILCPCGFSVVISYFDIFMIRLVTHINLWWIMLGYVCQFSLNLFTYLHDYHASVSHPCCHPSSSNQASKQWKFVNWKTLVAA